MQRLRKKSLQRTALLTDRVNLDKNLDTMARQVLYLSILYRENWPA